MTHIRDRPPNELRTGDLARRAGVSVRTVQFYDRVGLLKPSSYSEAGQRLYSEADLTRLEFILMLKRLGLRLATIRQALSISAEALVLLLETHKRNLYAQMHQLADVIERTEAAQRALLEAEGKVDALIHLHIVKGGTMTQSHDHIMKSLDSLLRDALMTQHQMQSLEGQRQTGEAWRSLVSEVTQVQHKGTSTAAVQALIERWDDLMQKSVGGDAALAVDLHNVYEILDKEGFSEVEGAEWLGQLCDAARFIGAARGSC